MPGKVLFSSVIDALTDSIQKFGIIRDEKSLETELDFIMEKMENVEIQVDEKWVVLQTNYSKLLYLSELVGFYNMPATGKFVQSLEKFMDNIDKQTIYYLQVIDWESPDSEFKIESDIIKKCLEKSVQQHSVFDKLQDVLKAYQILVCVVEDFRGEKCERILERDFLQEFEPKQKRRKV